MTVSNIYEIIKWPVKQKKVQLDILGQGLLRSVSYNQSLLLAWETWDLGLASSFVLPA